MITKAINKNQKYMINDRLDFSYEATSTDKVLDDMMESGLQQAKADESRPLTDVITDLKKNIQEWSR